jgi:hypothetical protein
MACVVRVKHAVNGDQYQVCQALAEAMALFDLADAVVPDARDAAYLYDVPGEDDPSAAVQAVQAGKGIILRRDTHHEWVNLGPEEQLRRAEL